MVDSLIFHRDNCPSRTNINLLMYSHVDRLGIYITDRIIGVFNKIKNAIPTGYNDITRRKAGSPKGSNFYGDGGTIVSSAE